jgi:hypothetical protein
MIHPYDPDYQISEDEESSEYATQGGGTAVWSVQQKRWEFKTPPGAPFDFVEGDPVPEQWGLAGPVR